MITPEYQEWKEMLMDEITRFPAARLFKDGRIITIPQCTNKGRLPLFYALPIEIVSKQKEYLDFPRCPYDPIWTTKYDDQINNGLFLQLIMDTYAWMFWQFIEVPDKEGNHHRMTADFNHYSGDFPVWMLCYRALSFIQQKFEEFGFSFKVFASLRHDMGVPWTSEDYFYSMMATVTPKIIAEQNWQPTIDDAWLNRTPEDFGKFASKAKTDFYRAWNHSRTKIGVMESLDTEENAEKAAALSRESFEGELLSKLRFADFVKTLSPRDQKIINLKMDNYTDQEVAAKVGYSTHSAVVKRIQHIAKCYDQYVQAEYEEYLKSFD